MYIFSNEAKRDEYKPNNKQTKIEKRHEKEKKTARRHLMQPLLKGI
jgi:hypothetical protein